MKLIETKVLKGTITVVTGLHVGGSKSSLDIGGLDSPVIKTPRGIPYIPGSSIKGKIRSLMGIKEGSASVRDDSEKLCVFFGSSVKNKETLSRVIFRDAFLDTDKFEKDFTNQNAILDTEYTEAKS